jgi:multiple sugar transport system permease protein
MKATEIRENILLIIAFVVTIIYLLPFFWLVMTSFKPAGLTWSYPPVFWFRPTSVNYEIVFSEPNFVMALLNSVIVTVVTTLIAISLGALGGFGLAKYKVGGSVLPFDYLTFFMLPPIIVVIPLFLVMRTLHLLDTRVALIISCLTFSLPFVVLMMRGIFLDTPMSVIEAAQLDGCTKFQAFVKVVLPISLSGLVGAATICSILTWNHYTYALILAYEKSQTLPLITAKTVTMQDIRWGEMSTLGIITTLAPLGGLLLLRKYALRGLTFGAVKE